MWNWLLQQNFTCIISKIYCWSIKSGFCYKHHSPQLRYLHLKSNIQKLLWAFNAWVMKQLRVVIVSVATMQFSLCPASCVGSKQNLINCGTLISLIKTKIVITSGSAEKVFKKNVQSLFQRLSRTSDTLVTWYLLIMVIHISIYPYRSVTVAFRGSNTFFTTV